MSSGFSNAKSLLLVVFMNHDRHRQVLQLIVLLEACYRPRSHRVSLGSHSCGLAGYTVKRGVARTFSYFGGMGMKITQFRSSNT
jgi:hypothetical protein